MNAQLREHARVPRLGFLGVGWIGRQRMQVLAGSGLAEVAAIADPHDGTLRSAREVVPDARCGDGLEALLQCEGLDGIVIATPSGAHASQAIAALDRGLAVFCQKPLTRTAAEADAVLAAARRADRLLAVDFSYRHVEGVARMRELVQGGAIGELFAIDLVFHNAYGPDKPWFRDLAQSGGGCVMDLGVHLVDLAAWIGGSGGHHAMQSQLAHAGRPLQAPIAVVEDYASAQWRLDSGAAVRMACSWNLSAGRDAVIGAAFHGSRGAVALHNVDGSFYDFLVEHYEGTARRTLAAPPDAWGGRALLDWARRLAADPGYDPAADALRDVARTVDAIYGR